MILSLRQRHRRVFAVLGVLLPVAFAAGVAARKPVPIVSVVPAELASPHDTSLATVWERGDLFAKNTITVRRLRASANAGRFAISFSAPPDFVKPDLLVYWVAGTPKITDKLPDDAQLLGSFSTRALVLPSEAATLDGSLVLFSLANQEIVDVSKAARFNESMK